MKARVTAIYACALVSTCHAFTLSSPLRATIGTKPTPPTTCRAHMSDQDGRRKLLAQALVLGGSLIAANQPAYPASNDLKADLAKLTTSNNRKIGGLSNKIRNIANVMDELQRDLMQEQWELVEQYPTQLRSFVPILTTYTDSAFPTDAPTDKGLRVALRYEVGRYFASLERLKQATARRALNEAYVAYADMSLHFDRYMRVGGIYTYYDDTISTEPYFKGISDDSLVYANPIKDPPEVRDLVVLVKGPDKGKTGILIGIYPDGNTNYVVKLERYKGMREIRVVPKAWAAKRLGEQDPDDVFLIPRKASNART